MKTNGKTEAETNGAEVFRAEFLGRDIHEAYQNGFRAGRKEGFEAGRAQGRLEVYEHVYGPKPDSDTPEGRPA